MVTRRLIFATLLIALGFVVGLALTDRVRETTQLDAQAPPAKPVSVAGPTATAALPDFTRIAERTVPAVVNISSRQLVRRESPFGNDPFFSFFGGGDDVFGSRTSVENSLGSGVVVSPDGYILTNNHVVTGESRRVSILDLDVSVSLADKRETAAKVIGVDPATDLALLKINAGSLSTIPWGDSSRLKVAEWVLAIGNPYQLSETVTLGIVSAVGRTNLGVSTYEDFVQTDAAINPGNSGGALVNARGELIGINTVIFSQSGGYQGIGFAVSSNLARRVVADLQKYGEVRRGSIGYVQIMPLTPQLAQEADLVEKRGLVVVRVAPDSSAFQAGLRRGDVILNVNGTSVTDTGQISRMIQDARIGSTIAIGISRGGRRTELNVRIVQPRTRAN